MPTEQEHWAVQIREIPAVFYMALLSDDHAIRHRPAAGEWSAVEVAGHMIDKMQIWTSQVERLMAEERPALPRYDQDVLVRDHDYLHADPEALPAKLLLGWCNGRSIQVVAADLGHKLLQDCCEAASTLPGRSVDVFRGMPLRPRVRQ